MTGEASLDTTVAIEAPEQIRFRFRVAGVAQRAMAHLLDLAIIALALVALFFFISWLSGPLIVVGGGDGFGRAQLGLLLVVLFLAQWGYFALFEGLGRGRTPGKAALALRVVKSGGEPVGFVDAVLRNLLRFADLLPFGYAAGVGCMLLDARFRRLGDLVAGTMVIVEDRLRVAVPLQIYPPTPEEAHSLPQRVMLDADEVRAIEAFLRRVPELGPALAHELASSIAPHLARRHGYQHPDPVRLLALLYARASVHAMYRPASKPASAGAVGAIGQARS